MITLADIWQTQPYRFVDFSTMALAIFGCWVAISPPKDNNKLKFLWLPVFLGIGMLGWCASTKQHANDKAEQTTFAHDLKEREDSFSKTLAEMKQTGDSILFAVLSNCKKLSQTDIAALVKAYLSVTKVPSGPVPSLLASVSTPTPPSQAPHIKEAPAMLSSGEILGDNFGAKAGQVLVHIRLKPQLNSDAYLPADSLLGGLYGSNHFPLPDNLITRWANSEISIKILSVFLDGLMDQISARSTMNGKTVPKKSDIEIGYSVVTPDLIASPWCYPPCK